MFQNPFHKIGGSASGTLIFGFSAVTAVMNWLLKSPLVYVWGFIALGGIVLALVSHPHFNWRTLLATAGGVISGIFGGLAIFTSYMQQQFDLQQFLNSFLILTALGGLGVLVAFMGNVRNTPPFAGYE